MVDADVLLLLDSANRTCGVPAKLYEYLGCNRPILALAEKEGDAAWVLQEARTASWIARPLETADIRNALLSLLQEFQRSAVGPIALDAEKEPAFTRESTAKQLAAILDAILHQDSADRAGCDAVACATPSV